MNITLRMGMAVSGNSMDSDQERCVKPEEADRGGRAAQADQADNHRVIDLTVFDREQDEQDRARERPSVAVNDRMTWTVDLTEAHASSARDTVAPSEEHTSSPRGARLVGTLAVVAVLVFAALSVATYLRGNQWRDIALEQRERGDGLEQQVRSATQAVIAADQAVAQAQSARDAALTAREAATGQLSASEQDVAQLEARIAALASEKARLEDDLAVAGDAREVTERSDTALLQCVMDVDAWLGRAPVDGEVESWRLWSSEATHWQSGCDAALAASRP